MSTPDLSALAGKLPASSDEAKPDVTIPITNVVVAPKPGELSQSNPEHVEFLHKELDKLQNTGTTTVHDLVSFIRRHLIPPRPKTEAPMAPNKPVEPPKTFDAEKHYSRR